MSVVPPESQITKEDLTEFAALAYKQSFENLGAKFNDLEAQKQMHLKKVAQIEEEQRKLVVEYKEKKNSALMLNYVEDKK